MQLTLTLLGQGFDNNDDDLEKVYDLVEWSFVDYIYANLVGKQKGWI